MARGIVRKVVPPSFPHGRQVIRRMSSGSLLGTGVGIAGRRVGGSPPINAVRVRGRSRRRG